MSSPTCACSPVLFALLPPGTCSLTCSPLLSRRAAASGVKFGLVTGGICSGLGKGVTMSSLGVTLQACGIRVTCLKIDPYLSFDASLLSPYEHGETYVLDDGNESDLDLGNYERFLGLSLTGEHNLTSGKIYTKVMQAERRGEYLGKTVQVIPHLTDAIQAWVRRIGAISVDGSGHPPQVCVCARLRGRRCLVPCSGVFCRVGFWARTFALRRWRLAVSCALLCSACALCLCGVVACVRAWARVSDRTCVCACARRSVWLSWAGRWVTLNRLCSWRRFASSDTRTIPLTHSTSTSAWCVLPWL